jgi:hypothetical protein
MSKKHVLVILVMLYAPLWLLGKFLSDIYGILLDSCTFLCRNIKSSTDIKTGVLSSL